MAMILRFNFRHCNFVFTYRLIAHDKFHFFKIEILCSWQPKFHNSMNEHMPFFPNLFKLSPRSWNRFVIGRQREKRGSIKNALKMFSSEMVYRFSQNVQLKNHDSFSTDTSNIRVQWRYKKSTFTNLPRYFFRNVLA